jgi:hypothetical protein
MATVTRKTIPTIWQGFISVTNADGTSAGSHSVTGADLSQFMADVFKYGTFLKGEPDRQCEVNEIERVCATCGGSGCRYRNGIAFPCKACKGQPVLETLPPFPLETMDCVQITR